MAGPSDSAIRAALQVAYDAGFRGLSLGEVMAGPSDSAIRAALQVAYDAGFRGLSLVYAVAIAIRESGLNPKARCYNVRDPVTGKVTCYRSPDGGPPPADVHVLSIDRGMWQINSAAHPNVSDAVADDPASAARAAYQISGQGTNFKAWVAYTTGAFRDTLSRVARLAGVDAGTLPPVGSTYGHTDPTGGAATDTGSATARSAGWTDVFHNPLSDFIGGAGDLAGGILGGVAGGWRKEILAGVTKLTVTATLLAGGAALVVLGAYRAVQPTVQKTQDRAADAAKLAAVA
jgi:hypothetical protein